MSTISFFFGNLFAFVYLFVYNYIAKIFRSKIVYIETLANSKTKTATGRLIYPIADLFIVQWEEMLKLYPKAKFGGWIY